MATTVLTPQIQFVTLAIGATAKQMGISATELYNRLNRHNLVRRLLIDCLVRRLLIDCYDTLHAESIEGVAWNVEQALRNWDAKEGGAR